MSTEIKLQYPVTVAGQEISSLSLRRPKVRDMIVSDKSDGSDADKEVTLFANLCEVDAEVILELDGKDYRAMQAAYSAFLS